MEKVTKAQVVKNLTVEWPDFLKRLSALPGESRAAYLQRQGFSTPVGLLAHVAAWWNDACRNIGRLKSDPDYAPPDQDVDAFNADVVKRSAGKSDSEAAAEFEIARKQLLQLVESLDEAQVENPGIQKELFWDVTNHFRDHRLES
jgi:hypothetical protein